MYTPHTVDNGTYYTGQVRLVGGDYPSEGRVEIYVYDVWSSIYTYYYTNYQLEAESICRQLGYTGALSYDQGTMLVVRVKFSQINKIK